MKKLLILVSMSEVKTEKTRTDGKISRQFYTAYFADANNPFAKGVQRNVFQAHSADGKTASWKGGNPSQVKTFVGKEIPGQIVNCIVKPYTIGENKNITSYTTALLDGENLVSILKQSGHELADSKASVAEVTLANASAALNS